MTKEQFLIIEKYMLQNVDESAHDHLHIYRVLNNALKISKKMKNIDYDVLVTSCLLHDIARPLQIENPTICHAIKGSEMAYDFLMEHNYSKIFCEKVKHCIATHRFRSDNEPKTIEAKVLFDADKLDVIGAIGISRTLMYNSDLKEPLYYLDFDGKIDYGLNLDAKESFLKEYNFKLKKLYKKFYTKEAYKISKKHKKISENFYQGLLEQIEISEFNDYKKRELKI